MFLNHACNVLKQQGEGVGKHDISLTIYIQETETYSKPTLYSKKKNLSLCRKRWIYIKKPQHIKDLLRH